MAQPNAKDVRDFLRLARRIAGRQRSDRETMEAASQMVLIAEWRRRNGIKSEDIKV